MNIYTHPRHLEAASRPIVIGRKLGQASAVGDFTARYVPDVRPDEFAEFELYCIPDWDGYGGAPISKETVQIARGFSRLLPMDAPRPDVAPGADGTIGFEWRGGSAKHRVYLLIDVGPGDKITARFVDENGRVRSYPETSLNTGAHALIRQLSFP